ncbi:MAG: response regulator [Boseongicola sp.]
MRETPLILIVDDQPDNREVLDVRLRAQGYETAQASDGEEALEKIGALLPDLVLLDVMMPKLDGFEVCRRVRATTELPFIPIVLVTARTETQDMVTGLDAGANDYLTKPVDKAALTARVRSMLRIKALQDQVQAQKAELSEWNADLENKVAAQVHVIERTNRLRRFLPKPVAEKILSAADKEDPLAITRTEIAVLFADLRGFTAFAEQRPPDVVMGALEAFHKCAGPLIESYGATLERFLGDGIVVLFNAPLTCPNPVERAIDLSREIHRDFRQEIKAQLGNENDLGLGIGIAYGLATLGYIGYESRLDYAAIGPPSNLAARLCDLAKDQQTLISEEAVRTCANTEHIVETGTVELKGIGAPLRVFRDSHGT